MNPNINNSDTNSSSAEKIQEVQKNAQLEKAARAEEGRNKLGSRAPLGGNGASGLNSGRNQSVSAGTQAIPSRSNSTGGSSGNSDSLRNLGRSLGQGAHEFKKQMAREGIKTAGQGIGIPKALTERALRTKPGDQLVEKVVSGNADPKNAAKDMLKGGKPDSEKTLEQKSDEKQKREIHSGEMSAGFSMKTIKKIAIFTPAISLIFIFFILLIACIVHEKSASIVLGNLVSESEGQDIYEKLNGTYNSNSNSNSNGERKCLHWTYKQSTIYPWLQERVCALYEDETGNGPGTELAINTNNGANEVGTANTGKYPAEYYKRLKNLGGVFINQESCSGDACLDNAEFMYYLKIADLSLRYKNKYHVTLDWALIVATNLYFETDFESMMEDNLSDYDRDTVEDYSTLSYLDWDIDYKNIPGYKYLSKDDSRYDLNILAKNMVKKTTTQTCTNSSGTIVSSQTDEDVEEQYFGPNGSKRLKCKSGETYNISNTYTKDLEKYDEFLLEYIDKKKFGDTSSSSNVSGNNMSETFVKLALSQLSDPEAVNGKKYWSWMGFNGRIEWCATFVSWVIEHTEYNGVKLSTIINHKSTCVYTFANYFYENAGFQFIYNDNNSKFKGKNGEGTYTPKEGDLIFFDWDGDWSGTMPTGFGPLDHIGIVQRVEGDKIITIEGNSSNMVAERTYNLNSNSVAAFGSWY